MKINLMQYEIKETKALEGSSVRDLNTKLSAILPELSSYDAIEVLEVDKCSVIIFCLIEKEIDASLLGMDANSFLK